MYLGPSTRWFKVTAHLFPKGTLQVDYESDWWKGRVGMLLTTDLYAQIGGQMNGQTN